MTVFWKAERRYRKRLPLDVRRLATAYFMPSSFPGSSRLFLVFPMASVGAVRMEHRASRPGEDLRCVRRLEPNRATRAAAGPRARYGRSEERRVGKGGVSRGRDRGCPYLIKQKKKY